MGMEIGCFDTDMMRELLDKRRLTTSELLERIQSAAVDVSAMAVRKWIAIERLPRRQGALAITPGFYLRWRGGGKGEPAGIVAGWTEWREVRILSASPPPGYDRRMDWKRHSLHFAIVVALSLAVGALLAWPVNAASAIVTSSAVLFVILVACCLGFQTGKRPPDAP
jgi:hypothetical protein